MISRQTRLLYSAGGAVYAAKEAAYTMFVLLFYSQVLGLDGSITGAMSALSLFWDAISDPLVGTWSDRLRSRFGRRHPFMFASILPLGIAFYALFAPPASVVESTAGLAGWLLFWSLWVRTAVTTFAIPHLALAADLTDDYHQRSKILGGRMGVMFLFAVLLPAIGLLVLFGENDGVDGRFVAANYPLYGALSCAVVWLAGSISSFGTLKAARPAASLPAAQFSPSSPLSLLRDLFRTMSNKRFRLLATYEIALMVAYGIVATMNMLVWTYTWGFDEQSVSIILSVPSLVAVALVLLSLNLLGRHFDKTQQLQLAMAGLVVNALWLYPAKLLGWLPSDGTVIFALNLLFMLFFMYCFMLRSVVTQSIVADISDEHELAHGIRQEGGFYAAINFINKLATVAGPVYTGIAMDVIGLPAGATPGEVDPVVLDRLIYALGVGVIPGFVIALFVVFKIRMREEEVTEVQAALRARQQGNADVAAAHGLGHNAPPSPAGDS